jgi:hypothetical protein
LISNWGLGLAFYLHGRAIDPTCDTKTKVARQLFAKAQELMTFVVSRLKLVKEEGLDRYVKRPHYHLSCVYSCIEGMEDESLYWLSKAKVKNALPRDSVAILADLKHIQTQYVTFLCK